MRIGKPEKFLIGATSVLAILTILFITFPELGILFSGFNETWLYGDFQARNPASIYFFVGLITFIGNAGIFTSIPYAAVIVMAAARNDVNPYILTVIAMLSAGIGEMTGYLLGAIGRKFLEKRGDSYLKKIETFKYLAENKRYILYLLVILVTATPLPDDIVFIPLGLIGFSLPKTMIASIIGKGVLVALLIFGGKAISKFFTLAREISSYAWVDDIIVYSIIVLGVYFFMKIDFNKLARLIEEKLGMKIPTSEEGEKQLSCLGVAKIKYVDEKT
ncbi:MAG: VTT domain-containing protein [Candidatus Njordarchaeales archaeon]